MGVEKGVRDDEEDNAVVPLYKEIKCLKIESLPLNGQMFPLYLKTSETLLSTLTVIKDSFFLSDLIKSAILK